MMPSPSTFSYTYISDISAKSQFKGRISAEGNFTYQLYFCTLIPGTYFVFTDQNTCLADLIPVEPAQLLRTIEDFPSFYSSAKLSAPIYDRVTKKSITDLNLTPYSESSVSYVTGKWSLISQSFDDRNVYHFLHVCLPTFKRVLDANPSQTNCCFLYRPSQLQITLFSNFFPDLEPVAFNLDSEDTQTYGFPRVGISFEQISVGKYIKSSKEDLIWIRNGLMRFVTYYQEDLKATIVFPKRIYISRRDVVASPRTLSNQDEVESFLSHLGFKSIVMTDYTIPQQTVLFHRADVIVFDHGAAGAWLPACTDNVKIIELISPRNSSTSREIATVYEEMCSLLGISHKMVVGNFSTENEELISASTIKYHIPIDKLMDALNHL